MADVPYLRGSGDLGACLFRLMNGIEKIGKSVPAVQLLSCGCGGKVDNTGALDAEPSAHPLAAELYASLSGVLAACGRADAVRLVQGFRPSPDSRA